MKTQAHRHLDSSLLEPFSERVERLADELRLAIRWDRPAILLAIYQSRYTMLEAQAALAERLRDLKQRFVHYVVNSHNADIALRLSQVPAEERTHTIFFVEGLQFGRSEALRALNIRREFFVEYRLRVVFWLTEKEAISLPLEAPDFWRLRSRVVEFMDLPQPERAAEIGRTLAWADLDDRIPREDLEAKIDLRLALLADLPEDPSTLATRAQLQYTLATLYGKKGDFDESLRYFHDAVQNAERLPSKRLLMMCYNGLGYLYDALGRHDEAVAAYLKAIELDPKDAAAWYNLGNTYHALGRHDEAIAAYLKAIELDPKDARPWNNLGIVYDNLDRHDEAIAAFLKAIELDPKYAAPWNGLGVVYTALGRYEEAIAAYQKAIELNLSDARPWNNLGNAYHVLGRHEEALAAFQKAIELDPKYAAPWNGLGVVYTALGRHDEAIATFLKATELDPQYATAWYTLGNVYRALGRREEAIAAFQKAIELDPQYAFPHGGLADRYISLGRLEEARRELEEWIRLRPHNTFGPLVALGILARHQGLPESEEHFRQALTQWDTAWQERWQSPSSLLEHKALALLCLGHKDEALATLQEALAQRRPDDEMELNYYELLRTAPAPPDGIEEMIQLVKAAP